MKVIILGSGTSTGVPMIGCSCEVCRSSDPKNSRTRASILVEHEGKNILIDTSTDLRQQALSFGITHIDAVLYTHTHADHLLGIDELRTFNFLQRSEIPIYGSEETIQFIQRSFAYIFNPTVVEMTKPLLVANIVEAPFKLFGMEVIPVEVMHGLLPIFGYRFDKFAYLTDCNEVPEESLELLKGMELLVIDALHHKPHPTHFTIEQAIEVINKIKPKRSLLTHMSHQVEHKKTNAELPKGIELAYDGMVIEI